MCSSNKDYSTKPNALSIPLSPCFTRFNSLAVSPWLGMGLSGTLLEKKPTTKHNKTKQSQHGNQFLKLP